MLDLEGLVLDLKGLEASLKASLQQGTKSRFFADTEAAMAEVLGRR